MGNESKDRGKDWVRRISKCPWVTYVSGISVCKLYVKPCFSVEPRYCASCEELKKHGSESDI
jgi:hypothetical protein